MIINQKTRLAIIEAYNGVCQYCTASEANHIEHIIPRAAGGSDELTNLTLACQPCNTRKRDLILPEAYIGLLLALAKSKQAKVELIFDRKTRSSIKVPKIKADFEKRKRINKNKEFLVLPEDEQGKYPVGSMVHFFDSQKLSAEFLYQLADISMRPFPQKISAEFFDEFQEFHLGSTWSQATVIDYVRMKPESFPEKFIYSFGFTVKEDEQFYELRHLKIPPITDVYLHKLRAGQIQPYDRFICNDPEVEFEKILNENPDLYNAFSCRNKNNRSDGPIIDLIADCCVLSM